MPYKILQITDTHLFANPQKMHGVNTNEKFAQTIEFIKKENLEFDAIFLTGDLSQDESPDSYKRITESLSVFKKDIFWIPGNHDDYKTMQEIFSRYSLFKQKNILSISAIDWNFIFINTTIEGKASGYLTASHLTQLLKNLNSVHKDSANALVMHHHPTEVGTPLIDQYILKNNEDFWKTLSEAAVKVAVIMCGHVHGKYDIIKNGTRLVSSPATCLQWKKGTDKMAIDERSGFTMWTFHPHGEYQYKTFMLSAD